MRSQRNLSHRSAPTKHVINVALTRSCNCIDVLFLWSEGIDTCPKGARKDKNGEQKT
jgi:hypothetical protein